MGYEDTTPAADKWLRMDGSVTTMAGEIILPADPDRAAEYLRRTPQAAKWLQPGGSIVDALPVSGGAGNIEFSADEVDTGNKWIDGSTIYRKCFRQKNIGNTSGIVAGGCKTLAGTSYIDADPIREIITNNLHITFGLAFYVPIGAQSINTSSIINTPYIHSIILGSAQGLKRTGDIIIKNDTGASSTNLTVYANGYIEYIK